PRPSGPSPGCTALIAWDHVVPTIGAALDRDALAVWLAAQDTDRLGARASSRGPSSRLNRLAHHLPEELTSRLCVATRMNDRGQRIVTLDIVGSARRARRAIDALRVPDGWIRRRSASTSSLRRTFEPPDDPREMAATIALDVDALLEAL